MWSIISKVFHSAVHNLLQVNRTKYLLTFVTVVLSTFAVFLIRINLSNNGYGSTIAKVVFWLLISTSGFFMIGYPWWLATTNSLLYYKRLEVSWSAIALVVYVLISLRTILAPVEHINNTDPNVTSKSFRVVSTFYWVVLLCGFFVVMPFIIRRRRLINSEKTQTAFFCMVLPCVLLAIASVVLQEWTGNGYLLSYSPVVIIVLYYLVKLTHAVYNETEENGVEFNEIYIIVAGFVPLWLGSVLGKSLIEVVNQGDVFGTPVIVMFWRIVIWVFEVVCSEIGRKATRMSDEAIFSFCAIYTGAVYAEFIFISVRFNSLPFYLLLLLEFCIIVFWQGGRLIDVQRWIVKYIPSSWPFLRKFKVIWLIVIGEMSPDLAEHCSYFWGSSSQYPLDVQLSLIRSRAAVVQITWGQNDIKMASELQSLACATTAVAADLVFSSLGVGVELIASSSKLELFYIYCCNLLVILVAQAIAQYEIKLKVQALKRDVTKVVTAITEMKNSQKLSEEPPAEAMSKPLGSKNRRRSIVEMVGSAMSSTKEALADSDENHFQDLQDILDIATSISPDNRKTRSSRYLRRKSSSYESAGPCSRRSSCSEASPSSGFEEDMFGDDSPVLSEDNQRHAGHMKIKRYGEYQRKYFILTPTRLLYFHDEKDVTRHVSAVEGKVNVSDIERVERVSREDFSSLRFQIVLKNKTAIEFEAFTEIEADAWLSKLSKEITASPDEENNDSSKLDFGIIARKGSMGAHRRASLGGISALINQLKYPTKSKLPTKSGYLKKFNNILWQRRYFVLEETGELRWYSSAKDAEERRSLKNSLSMDRILSVSPSEEDACRFEIVLRGKVYQLKASSAGQVEEWCTCITSWVEFTQIQQNDQKENKDQLFESKSNISDDFIIEDSSNTASLQMTACPEKPKNERKPSVYALSRRHSMGTARPVEKRGKALIRTSFLSIESWKRCEVCILCPGVFQVVEDGVTSATLRVNTSDILSVDDSLGSDQERDGDCVLEIILRGKTIVIKLNSAEDKQSWKASLQLWMQCDVSGAFQRSGHGDSSGTSKRRESFFDVTMGRLRAGLQGCERDAQCRGSLTTTDLSEDSVTPNDTQQQYVYDDHRIDQCGDNDDRGGDIAHNSSGPSRCSDLTRLEKIEEGRAVGISDSDHSDGDDSDDGGGVSGIVLSGSREHDHGSCDSCLPHSELVTLDKVEEGRAVGISDSDHNDDHGNDDSNNDSNGREGKQDVEEEAAAEIKTFSAVSRFFGRVSEGFGETVKHPRHSLPQMEKMHPSHHEDNKIAEADTNAQSNESTSLQNDFNDEQFVAYIKEKRLIRRQTQLPTAWSGSDYIDKGAARQRVSALLQMGLHERARSESTFANEAFMQRNTTSDHDDFVNKLKTRSYHELNQEFWQRHRWYLLGVVGYVTLQVLSVTSYMIRETSFIHN